MPPAVVACGCGLLWLALCLNPALAHGPAPTVLSAMGTAEAPAQWLRTNLGFARDRGDGFFDYLCPAHWGQTERVAPAALVGEALWIASEGVLYRGDGRGCGFVAEPLPGWTGGAVSAIAPWSLGALVVSTEAGGSALWSVPNPLAAPTGPVALAGTVDSLRVDGETPWLVGARPAPWIQRGLDGVAQPLQLPEAVEFLTLRWVDGERLFMAASTATGPVLLESTDGGAQWRARARGLTSLHGPVLLDGAWLATVDGQVARRDAAGDFVAAEAVGWTCLQAVQGVALACADRGLWRLGGSAAAPTLAPLFAFHQLLGPPEGCPSGADLRSTCAGQWLHSASESGLYRLDGGVDDAGAALAEGGARGCQQTPGGPAGWAIFGLGLLWRRRRSGGVR